MDNIDHKIIAILQENGRLPNSRIGTIVGISEGTVRRRLKYLTDNKIIKITAIPDLEKMGYSAAALVGIRTDPDKIESVADRLAALSELQYIALTTGSFDIFVWVAVYTAKELGIFLREKIGLIPGIRRTETFVSLSTNIWTQKPAPFSDIELGSGELSS